MPVLYGDEYRDGSFKFYPFELLNEERAQKNHTQSLEALAKRGGMHPIEMLANILDKPYNDVAHRSTEYAIDRLRAEAGRVATKNAELPMGAVNIARKLLYAPFPISDDDIKHGAETIQAIVEAEMGDFAEWISSNGYTYYASLERWYKSKSDEGGKDTRELIELYKKENGQI